VHGFSNMPVISTCGITKLLNGHECVFYPHACSVVFVMLLHAYVDLMALITHQFD